MIFKNRKIKINIFVSFDLTDFQKRCCSAGMAFSSSLSRLNLIPKPSLPYALNTLKSLNFHKLLRINGIRPCISSNDSAARFSALKMTSSAGIHTQISRPQDDLIVLGIETSCDDTAAAIVSYRPCFTLRIFERVLLTVVNVNSGFYDAFR